MKTIIKRYYKIRAIGRTEDGCDMYMKRSALWMSTYKTADLFDKNGVQWLDERLAISHLAHYNGARNKSEIEIDLPDVELTTHEETVMVSDMESYKPKQTAYVRFLLKYPDWSKTLEADTLREYHNKATKHSPDWLLVLKQCNNFPTKLNIHKAKYFVKTHHRYKLDDVVMVGLWGDEETLLHAKLALPTVDHVWDLNKMIKVTN